MTWREERHKPAPWVRHKESVHPRWAAPFHVLEWVFEWTAYYLSRWAFLAVLEYLSALSVLIAVIFFFAERGDRKKQKHYQAWQVINTAQGHGGSGGRIEALHELNMDHIPLTGVNAAGAFLQGVQLHKASLVRANLEACDLRDSNLSGSDLEFANLHSANLRNGNLQGVNLKYGDLEDADLAGANLAAADLSKVTLKNADLRMADLRGVRWQAIESIEQANVYGVRNAPEGFLAWALQRHAVNTQTNDEN